MDTKSRNQLICSLCGETDSSFTTLGGGLLCKPCLKKAHYIYSERYSRNLKYSIENEFDAIKNSICTIDSHITKIIKGETE